MTFLVHGATGAQGAPVVQALLADGHPVLALSRGGAAPLGAVPQVRADLEDVESLTAAYAGASGVFVHLPITGDPQAPDRWTAAISDAAKAARPARIVLSTSGGSPAGPDSPFGAGKINALRGLAAQLRAAGLTVTVLAPRLFLENLLLPVVLEGVTGAGELAYPVADDQPVAWSSHLDVAAAAVAALTGPHAPETVDVGHAPGLTGTDLAAAFAAHVDRPVRYRALEPAEFGRLLAPLFGAPAAAGIQASYEALDRHPELAFRPDTGSAALLGIAPRPVGAWLAELKVGQPAM